VKKSRHVEMSGHSNGMTDGTAHLSQNLNLRVVPVRAGTCAAFFDGT
jgi:hypothetical protein